jgi:YesN/AraC family two-component response regulator
MTIRVAVANDQAIIRSGLRVQVSLAPDVEFVGEASNGEQPIAVAGQQRPDVMLMDVRMP